jgi:hypothetical protein
MDYEGRRYQVAEMTGHRISRVVVEDIAAPSSEAPVNKSTAPETIQ